MQIKLSVCIAAFALSSLHILINSDIRADTIILENGGRVEGIVQRSDDKAVEVNIGFGTITFARKQVREIRKSTPDEQDDIRNKWEEKREELQKSETEFAEARERRFTEYEKWTREERERKLKEEHAVKSVQAFREEESRGILVNALLNDSVKATLVLDTGASVVVLSRRIGEELGMDLEDTKKNIVTLHLADGRNVQAKALILKSIRIEDVEVKDVISTVILDSANELGLRDGLLGMSFLSRFNLKVDSKNMKIIFEKIA